MKFHMQVLIALGLGLKRNWHIFAGLILGVLVGIWLHNEPSPLIMTTLTFIGQVFIRLIQMVVIPLVISAIVIGITSVGDGKQISKIGTKMIAYYGIITIIAVTVGAVLALLLKPGLGAAHYINLDTAADIITRGAVRKLDYSHITTNLTELPYLDYKTFVFYNIMDTIAQKCIEMTVEDIDYIFATAVNNDTRYSKCHRQTVYLTNRGAKEFMNDGFVMGNNANRGSDPPTTKFPGAFVANPKKLNDYSKQRILCIAYTQYTSL